jgi:hypothetical protein
MPDTQNPEAISAVNARQQHVKTIFFMDFLLLVSLKIFTWVLDENFRLPQRGKQGQQSQGRRPRPCGMMFQSLGALGTRIH